MNISKIHAFTIVLTQPRNGIRSRILSEKVTDFGYMVLDFPLIDISATDNPIPLISVLRSLEKYELSIFMSPNSIHYTLDAYNVTWPVSLPIGVIGPGSVATLAHYGISEPIHRIISPSLPFLDSSSQKYDSEHLYAAINEVYKKNGITLDRKRVLIVRGENGRKWLENRLRNAGADVLIVTPYRYTTTELPIGLWNRVHVLIKGLPHAWFITSSYSLKNLCKLAKINLTDSESILLKCVPIVTPYPRIEKTARALGFKNITLTGFEDDLITKAFHVIAEESI